MKTTIKGSQNKQFFDEAMRNSNTVFPVTEENGANSPHFGIMLRQYAAIKLHVPDSGDEWLDAMILASLRDKFAAMILPSYISYFTKIEATKLSYDYADIMLAERSK